MLKKLTIFVLLNLGTACQAPTAALEQREIRGQSALTEGTCLGACGGKSYDGTCWCDEACANYGDCCDDHAASCTAPGTPKPTCEGACGGKSNNGNCWCDDECEGYGDCCADAADLCSAPVCPGAMCKIACEFGFAVDENGCEVCACKQCEELGNPKALVYGQSPEQCMTMKFGCEAGYVHFFNDCGCGCMPEPVPAADSCQNRCGQTSSGDTCWCDAECASYGDCCADVALWCE